MNQLRLALAGAAAATGLALAGPGLAHPDHSTKEEVREIKIVKADKNAIGKAEFVANCGKGRKFESTSATGEGADKKQVNKMVICSDPGESDAAWEKTLRDALARVEANEDMAPEGKARIMADLRIEIAKIGK